MDSCQWYDPQRVQTPLPKVQSNSYSRARPSPLPATPPLQPPCAPPAPRLALDDHVHLGVHLALHLHRRARSLACASRGRVRIVRCAHPEHAHAHRAVCASLACAPARARPSPPCTAAASYTAWPTAAETKRAATESASVQSYTCAHAHPYRARYAALNATVEHGPRHRCGKGA